MISVIVAVQLAIDKTRLTFFAFRQKNMELNREQERELERERKKSERKRERENVGYFYIYLKVFCSHFVNVDRYSLEVNSLFI